MVGLVHGKLDLGRNTSHDRNDYNTYQCCCLNQSIISSKKGIELRSMFCLNFYSVLWCHLHRAKTHPTRASTDPQAEKQEKKEKIIFVAESLHVL